MVNSHQVGAPLLAETIGIRGYDGDVVPAYLARPVGTTSSPGVVVIHHMPGWDEATKEITRRFAAAGFVAICPHLHHRDAPGAAPDDAAAAARAAGGVPDERFLGDCEGAVLHLRTMPSCSGRIAAIGYCSGGRQSFLAACSLSIDAAIVCYGAFIGSSSPSGMPPVMPVLERASGLRAPVLGLFGAEDTHPTPAEVGEIDEELNRLGKAHEFHVFEDAGHSFFAVDRPAYRPAAATAGWRVVLSFLERTISDQETAVRGR